MSTTAASARNMMEDNTLMVQEKARTTLESVRQSGVVQNYIKPVTDYGRRKYQQSPRLVQITLMAFSALSAVPLACFAGFMAVVTLGCLIVGGIAFTIVEGGFAMLASAFLLPALGLVLLITGALGLFGGVMYAGYIFACYVIGLIWGQGQKRDIQRMAGRAAEQADRATDMGAGSRG
ncbi:hypothetical protein EDD11_003109 [Mortierella claussenii]|nr:hypothetical protein EDD11_003109 [Mortierella claussenii]